MGQMEDDVSKLNAASQKENVGPSPVASSPSEAGHCNGIPAACNTVDEQETVHVAVIKPKLRSKLKGEEEQIPLTISWSPVVKRGRSPEKLAQSSSSKRDAHAANRLNDEDSIFRRPQFENLADKWTPYPSEKLLTLTRELEKLLRDMLIKTDGEFSDSWISSASNFHFICEKLFLISNARLLATNIVPYIVEELCIASSLLEFIKEVKGTDCDYLMYKYTAVAIKLFCRLKSFTMQYVIIEKMERIKASARKFSRAFPYTTRCNCLHNLSTKKRRLMRRDPNKFSVPTPTNDFTPLPNSYMANNTISPGPTHVYPHVYEKDITMKSYHIPPKYSLLCSKEDNSNYGQLPPTYLPRNSQASRNMYISGNTIRAHTARQLEFSPIGNLNPGPFTTANNGRTHLLLCQTRDRIPMHAQTITTRQWAAKRAP